MKAIKSAPGIMVAAILMMIASAATIADTTTGVYSARGARTCSAFLTAQKTNSMEYLAIGAWVAGYVTAYNKYTPKTYDIMGNTDVDGALLWIRNYCEKEPLNDLSDAIAELIKELHPRRKLAPN